MVVTRDGYTCGELSDFSVMTRLITEVLLVEFFIYNAVQRAAHS